MVGDGPKLYPSGGSPVTLGTAGGLAMAVNASREVVGTTGTFDISPSNTDVLYATTGEPFYWKPGMAEPFILDHDSTRTDFQARSINSAGTIVGSAAAASVVWKDGIPYNLNDFLISPPTDFRLFGAADINASGQIAAYALWPNSSGIFRYAILLTPVPPGAAQSMGEHVGTLGDAVRIARLSSPSAEFSSHPITFQSKDRIAELLLRGGGVESS